ncbi:MAG: MarR family winged helix-turn-helix transcriptional regulator [Anaerolineae bacterium]
MKGILRSARRIINAELEPLNLSGAEGDILFHLLTGSDKIRQEQLAEQLDIGKAAVSRAIDSLESKRYVVRMRHPQDRRAYCVSLTDQALAVGADIVDIYERLYMLVRQGIADEDFAHIESVLSRVAANLQSMGKENA